MFHPESVSSSNLSQRAAERYALVSAVAEAKPQAGPATVAEAPGQARQRSVSLNPHTRP